MLIILFIYSVMVAAIGFFTIFKAKNTMKTIKIEFDFLCYDKLNVRWLLTGGMFHTGNPFIISHAQALDLIKRFELIKVDELEATIFYSLPG